MFGWVGAQQTELFVNLRCAQLLENMDLLMREADELMKIISSIIIKVKANSNWTKK
jgi:hypothetical protein